MECLDLKYSFFDIKIICLCVYLLFLDVMLLGFISYSIIRKIEFLLGSLVKGVLYGKLVLNC